MRKLVCVVSVFLISTILFSPIVYAADTSWTGLGDGIYWSDAGNWDNGIPSTGATLDLSDADHVGGASAVNNDLINLSLSRFRFTSNGNFFRGYPIKLSEGIFDSSPTDGNNNVVGTKIIASDNLIFKAGNFGSLAFWSADIGRYNLYLNSVDNGSIGPGKVTSSGGIVIVNGASGDLYEGTDMTNSEIDAQVIVKQRGTLGGDGRTGPLTVNYSGKVKPNYAGCIRTHKLSFSGELHAQVSYDDRSDLHDPQCNISTRGTVRISSGARLKFLRAPSHYPEKGQSYNIIRNDGTDPVIGRFMDKPEGAVLKIASWNFRLSYRGGSGNDIVVTRL